MIRVAVTGPESTGKSELCNLLNARLGGLVVDEFARQFLEQHPGAYTFETVEYIAREQLRLQQDAFAQQPKYVFCDTDMLVIRVWMEHVFGRCPDWIVEESHKPVFDYTLLMNIDLPWVDDPLREHPHQRAALLAHYQRLLAETQRPYTLISGSNTLRLENALKALNV